MRKICCCRFYLGLTDSCCCGASSEERSPSSNGFPETRVEPASHRDIGIQVSPTEEEKECGTAKRLNYCCTGTSFGRAARVCERWLLTLHFGHIYPLSPIPYSLPPAPYPLPPVPRPLSPTRYLYFLSPVSYPPSPIPYPLYPISYLLSPTPAAYCCVHAA